MRMSALGRMHSVNFIAIERERSVPNPTSGTTPYRPLQISVLRLIEAQP